MNAEGLPEKWRRLFQRDGNLCEKYRKKKKKKCEQQITLKNMSGSFVVLLVGMFSSVVVFIIELILRCRESATVTVLSVAKTGALGQIKSAAVKQMSPDNESSAIVISPVEPVITRSLKLYRVKNQKRH